MGTTEATQLDAAAIDCSVLARFSPLDSLSPEHLNTLAAKASIRSAKPGQFLFQRGEEARQAIFLLSGEVELRGDTDIDVRIVPANGSAAKQWLAHKSPRAYTARVVTPVRYLAVEASLLDLLLGSEHGSGCELAELGSGANAAADEWTDRIARLPGSRVIPAANLQQLFVVMHDVAYKAGDAVFRQGDESTHFHVIKSGRCAITRERPNGESLKLAELEAGDVFGQDELIAGTPRAATARMTAAGTVARIPLREFRSLLEAPLVQKLAAGAAADLVKSGKGIWIDVRVPADRARGHLPNDIHLPLELVRLRRSALDPAKTYLAYCDNGKRAAVAAFLLRGWGFEAYAVPGALASSR